MPQAYITLEDGTGTEQSLSDWGFALEGSTLRRSNAAQDALTLPLPGASIAATPLFAFEDILTLRVGRTRTGSAPHYTYSGGSIKFQGKMQNPVLVLQGQREVVTYVIAGPWYDLEHTLFQQTISSWNGSAMVQTPRADLCLFTKYDTGTGGLDIITTAQQITEVLNYLLSVYSGQSMTAPFQVGTIDTRILVGGVSTQVNVPTLTCKPMMCSEAIRKCLQISPDAVLWFDYTTNPPTVNVKRQSSLTAKTLAIADGVSHKSIRLVPRYDLQVRGVKISYKTTGSVNGNNYVEYTDDKYPVSFPAGDGGLRVVVESVDLAGAVLNTIQKNVIVASAAAAVGGTQANKRAFWSLLQSKFADYHVRFQDGASPPNATTIPDATIVDEDTGSPVSLSTYPNVLREGTVEPWMTLSSGTGVIAKRCLISSAMAYAEYDSSGSSDTDTTGNRLHLYPAKTESKRVTLTNAITGTYKTFSTFIPGEGVPVGLASTIYTAMNVLQYEGTHSIVQSQIGPDSATIGMGNTLNLSGGETAWTTMAALIQSITEDLGRGTTDIDVGPAKHLNAQELWSILSFWRFRLPIYNTLARASGIAGDSTSVEINRNVPKSDTDHSTPHQDSAQLATMANTGGGSPTGNAVINWDLTLMAGWLPADVPYASRVMQPRLVTLADGSKAGVMATKDGMTFSGGLTSGGLGVEVTITAVNDDYVTVSGIYQVATAAVHSGGGGTGYAMGDIVTLGGSAGIPSATFEVTSESGGVVSAVSVVNAGTYLSDPAGSGVATTGGSGSGLTLDITSTSSVNVAKQPRMRIHGSPITETLLGVTYTYNYSDSNHRTSSDGTNTENAVLVPSYETSQKIDAVPCQAISVSGGTVTCYLFDSTNRAWAAA